VTEIVIAAATTADVGDWVRLRQALGPHGALDTHHKDILDALAHPHRTPAFVARFGGMAVGFAEASLRTDYVNGCKTSPVAFLEGIYVAPEHRRSGIAAKLVRAVEDWAVQAGCTEFASDTDIANHESQAMHTALGFSETQRVVYFRKLVSGKGDA
jgi:aminoglycoside 6'-N-acetyltransferase I